MKLLKYFLTYTSILLLTVTAVAQQNPDTFTDAILKMQKIKIVQSDLAVQFKRNTPANNYRFQVFHKAGEYTNSSVINTTVIKAGSFTPNNLVNFTATYNNCSANLNWEVSSDLKCCFYKVECSADNTSFFQIYSLASKNNSNGATYSYNSSNFGVGINYYRLKLVQSDSSVIYSNTISLLVNPATLPKMTAPFGYTVSCGQVPAASRIPYNNYNSGNCSISGISNLSTITALPGTAGGMVTESWTATDKYGRNIEPVSRVFTIDAATTAFMHVPTAISVAFCGIPLPTALDFSNHSDGGCLVTGKSNLSTITEIPAAVGGTMTETWSGTDSIGRLIPSVSRIITIIDLKPANMTAPFAYHLSCGYIPPPSKIVYSNNLGISCLITGLSNPSTFTTTPGIAGGTITETWTATDGRGQKIEPVSRVFIVDAAVLPKMKAPAAITVAYNAIPAASRIFYTNASGGNCLVNGISNASSCSAMPGATGGTITETWTAKDIAGRIIEPVSRTITVTANTNTNTTVIPINPLPVSFHWAVYPNPSRGNLNFLWSADTSKIKLVEIVDLLGKVVYSSIHYQPQIILSNKPAGLYFIMVHTDAAIATTKFVLL